MSEKVKQKNNVFCFKKEKGNNKDLNYAHEDMIRRSTPKIIVI